MTLLYKEIKKHTILFFILLSFTYSSIASSLLSEQNVRQFVQQVDDAVKAKNIDEFSKHLSSDVEITMSDPLFGSSEELTLNKEEYISLVRKGLASAKNYIYRRKSLDVTINNDKAYISGKVFESFLFYTAFVSANTLEEATIEMKDGKLAITKVTGTLTR
ncbi:hypothetical protein [Endozoicomonas arenosclerae]|uniref:hypothetical protein n=1 Tax=Endozoicomonas arenosclerae TaxID=1633495 RepID=UPI0007829EF2|nr:hypothetical protein [Endozoicomonas arenosclerae]